MSAPRFHIVFAEPFEPWAVERARMVAKVTQWDGHDPRVLDDAIRYCDALLVRSKVEVSRGMLERAERLMVVGRSGVGLETIDLQTAGERGVAVVYTPLASTDAVADLTVSMILALKRRLLAADAMVRDHRFAQARIECVGEELGSLTLGIVGLGRIGRAVARRCSVGFGMSVLFNDIVEPTRATGPKRLRRHGRHLGHLSTSRAGGDRPLHGPRSGFKATWSPLDFAATSVTKQELYRKSDIVSLHVPLTDLTRHLIDDDSLSLFKRGAVLINTSRGEVIHSEAVANALRSGVLSGAGIDVFDSEPPSLDHPLLQTPNTLLTPHLGARTTSALRRMNSVIEDVIAVLEGRQPKHLA